MRRGGDGATGPSPRDRQRALLRAYENPPQTTFKGPDVNWHKLLFGRFEHPKQAARTAATLMGVDPGVVRARLHGNLTGTLGPGGRPLAQGEVTGSPLSIFGTVSGGSIAAKGAAKAVGLVTASRRLDKERAQIEAAASRMLKSNPSQAQVQALAQKHANWRAGLDQFKQDLHRHGPTIGPHLARIVGEERPGPWPGGGRLPAGWHPDQRTWQGPQGEYKVPEFRDRYGDWATDKNKAPTRYRRPTDAPTDYKNMQDLRDKTLGPLYGDDWRIFQSHSANIIGKSRGPKPANSSWRWNPQTGQPELRTGDLGHELPSTTEHSTDFTAYSQIPNRRMETQPPIRGPQELKDVIKNADNQDFMAKLYDAVLGSPIGSIPNADDDIRDIGHAWHSANLTGKTGTLASKAPIPGILGGVLGTAIATRNMQTDHIRNRMLVLHQKFPYLSNTTLYKMATAGTAANPNEPSRIGTR